MAIVVYPLNNIDFSAEDVGIYNSTRTSGIYAGDDFAISLSGLDNTISIDVGIAWMRLSRFFGVAVAHKTKISVDMGLPNASFPRIDALVLRFDANKNGAELVSKQGTASSDPKPPEVSRTGAYHELHLLHVRRNAGAAVISAADVTDLRLNEQYCGLMADAVTRVDTDAINAQVTELIQKLRDDLKAVQDQTYYASKEEVAHKVDKSDVVNDFTASVPGYVADARTVKILNDCKLTMELLWQNGKPDDAFGAQTINIDFSAYDICCILFNGATNDTHYKMAFVPVGYKTWLHSEWNARLIRTATVSATAISFSDGRQGMYNASVATSNTACVPVKIFGVKGVIT